MEANINSPTFEITEADIQRAGYLLWQEYGHPRGGEDEFVSKAREILRPRDARGALTRFA